RSSGSAAARRPDPASRRGPAPASGPDQYPQVGGVEEPDLVQVDDELVAAPADQVDEQLPQPRRRIDIDLALHVDDLEAVRGVVTQLQIHTSSSAMPGVISPSIPAPLADVVRGQGGSSAALSHVPLSGLYGM